MGQTSNGPCPSTLTTVGNLGVLYESIGDYDKAEAFYNRALEARERLLGPEHPSTLTTVGNLGGLYSSMGDYDKAEAFYNRALEARERLLGPEHPDTNTIIFHLASVYSRCSRRNEAIPLRRRELDWCRTKNGDNDPGTLTSINELAIDLREIGELDEAEALFRELLATRLQILDQADEDIARSFGGLSKTLVAAGKLEEACLYAAQALRHRRQHEGADAWMTNMKRFDLAQILHSLSRSTEAIPLLREIRDSLGSIEEPDDEELELLTKTSELLAQMSA